MAKFGSKSKSKTKKPRKRTGGKSGGKKSNAWRAYTGGGGGYTPSNAPLPD